MSIQDEYDFDFGFSTISEEEFNAKATQNVESTISVQEDIGTVNNKLSSLENKLNDIFNMIDYQMNDTLNYKEKLNGIYIDRMKQLEQAIIPLLSNLLKTSDNEYIYWPNRRALLEKQIEKIKNLTRDENIFVD